MNILVVKDLSARFGVVRDQGQRPTCLAFALSDLHASFQLTTFAPLSVEYLYYHAWLLENPSDPHSGVSLPSALHAIQQDGQPEEPQWPYLPQLPDDLSTYKPPPINGPLYRRRGKHISGNVVGKIADELTADRVCMLVFYSSIGLILAQPGTPVSWSSARQLLNAHAVLAVGIGEGNSERLVKIRNSWGAGWAESGHAWLTEDYVSNTFLALIGMV